MRKKLLIICIIAGIILIGSVSAVFALDKSSFGKFWGEFLGKNAYQYSEKEQIESGNIFLAGKDVIITNAEMEQSKSFYVFAGYEEDEALKMAIEYTEKYETMYAIAKQKGYKASEQEIDERISMLREAVAQSEDKETFDNIVQGFESEDAYWEYERIVLSKDIAIEKYREAEIKPLFDQIATHEKGSTEYWSEWAEWYDEYQAEMVAAQNFRFADDLSEEELMEILRKINE